jgi:hypothetical protein
MKSIIVPMLCIVLCVAAFGIRTSGQTPRTYEIIDEGGAPPIPTVHSEIPNTLTSLAITSDYHAQPKVLVLHLFNGSGKDITGYTIVIRHKKADGTLDENGRSESMEDMLGPLITSQMAKDLGAPESVRQQNPAVFPTGYGVFLADETRDKTLNGINSASELDIIAGAVFYVDGTYDHLDKDAFKRTLEERQGALKEMKEANELIRNALADSSNDHPVAAVLTELNKRRLDAMDKPGRGFFRMDTSTLQNMQRPQLYGPQKGMSERERLTKYVEEQEKRVELMTPHCHLEIALK